MGLVLHVVFLCLALSGVRGFKPNFGNSITHQRITETAILRKTAEVCLALATAEGRDFVLPASESMSAFGVKRACTPSDTSSATKFKDSIVEIYNSNVWVDKNPFTFFSERHHFDDESFIAGKELITQGMTSIKANIREQNFKSARDTLGKICHTLQDFYSHSNWIELGEKHPYTNLIRPDQLIENVADAGTATCRNCEEGSCEDNILPEIIAAGKLTSGYFGVFSSKKPPGKCSHGGSWDRTSRREPVGGINKDEDNASHGRRHRDAANMAINATMELLEDIRGAAGEEGFLRLMGITRSSVLCFVIDTTGSMSDDIAEAKRVAFSIIDSKKGTADDPSSYILVPFNDPDFGPLIRTTDSEVMKAKISELQPIGGGDAPEMCLSGLQLALTGAPPSSQMFVFTDAAAKDVHLKSTILALIQSTKSVVSFMLTKVFFFRRRRDSGGDQDQGQRFTSRLSGPDIQLYQDLAVASGGQAIEVTKATLPQATNIIVDTTTSALVNILQSVRNPGRPDKFSFLVDESVRNLTIYITGRSLTFSLYSPSGVSQNNTATDGPLGTIQSVGNLYTIRLQSQEGLWKISLSSTQPYTLKVTGQSSIDFIYNFVETFQGAHSGFALKEGRPQADSNATLLVSVVGEGSLTVTEVSLVEVSGSSVENGTVEAVGGGDGDYLVYLNRVPAGDFVVLLKGIAGGSTRSSHSTFQRQSTTQLRASSVTVTAHANTTLEPGGVFFIPFTVTTNGTGGNYTIRAQDDREFVSSFPPSLTLESGGSAQGSVELKVPKITTSGTDVTLTIEAEDPSGSDSNYVVLRLSVVTKVTDFSRPVCTVVSVSANCSEDCSGSQWELSANLTDGNGTGILRLSTRLGNGTLNTTTSTGEGGVNITLATYSASCCSPEVEIVAVDAVGNVGTCFHSIRAAAGPSLAPNTTVTNSTPAPTSPAPTTSVPTTTPSSASSLRLSLLLLLCSVFLLITALCC